MTYALLSTGQFTDTLHIRDIRYGQVDQDGSRYLLGDFLGNLYILVLIAEGDSVVDLKLERLGGVSALHTYGF